MAKPEVDPKRTGVKAVEINVDQSEFVGGSWYSEPGSVLKTHNKDGTLYGLTIACPGCGMQRSFMTCERGKGFKRDLEGMTKDVSTLSFTNGEINNPCCGWRGFFIKGTFELATE